MNGLETEEENCLCHRERNNLEEVLKCILTERKVKPIETDGFLKVNCGPKYEDWTLKKVQENFQNSKEWEQVKSFSCIPNLRDLKLF